MTWPIQRLTVDEFMLLLQGLAFSRKVDSVHLHHTWRPNHAQWRGQATVEAMRRVHMQERGFSDIAQHLTIDPFGGIWTGRDWNHPPASAKGKDANGRAWNGDLSSGPFMIEMVGDFDDGKDVLQGAQYESVVDIVGTLLWRFQLPLAGTSVLGHTQMSSKSCPGSSLTAAATGGGWRLNSALTVAFDARAAALQAASGLPATTIPELPLPANLRVFAADQARGTLASAPVSLNEAVPEDAAAQADILDVARALQGHGSGSARGAVDPRYHRLYGHVINTARGLLLETAAQSEQTGAFLTSQDELAGDHFGPLQEYVQELAPNVPLRLVFHAHGGLVAERNALDYALEHLDWWKRVGAFPFFLIWETGLMETLFERHRGLEQGRGALDWLFDRTDWLLEKALGPAGMLLWDRMKANAELCSAFDWRATYARLGGATPPANAPEGIAGGARCFVRALLPILEAIAKDRPVELHAIGHSAGSIYHAHFLPMLLEERSRRAVVLRTTPIKTLHLLAPAVRIDDFEELLGPAIGRGIERVVEYTMDDRREREDSVAVAYRKSLLYFVNEACERDEPGLLGLQKSLQSRIQAGGNPTATAFAAGGLASVYFSDGKREPRTRATSHGDFDNDPATMTSVAEFIIRAKLSSDQAYGSWIKPRPKRKKTYQKRAIDLADGSWGGTPPEPTRALDGRGTSAARRALCIGIDAYPPGATLAGCVNDSRQWGAALGAAGFSVEYLHDADASRAALLARIRELTESTRSGDWLVVQFAGHGTQLQDFDGDEALDQAFVPHDYRSHGCLLDDELYGLIKPAASRGVRITLFFDTCHSGSASGFAPLAAFPRSGDRRARFLPADFQMNDLQRQISGGNARAAKLAKRDPIEWVHLAACLDDEYAYETSGSGDFTRVAAPLLSRAQHGAWSADTFLSEIRKSFPAGARQTPTMMPSRDPDRRVLPDLDRAPVSGGAIDVGSLVPMLEQALAAARRLAQG